MGSKMNSAINIWILCSERRKSLFMESSEAACDKKFWFLFVTRILWADQDKNHDEAQTMQEGKSSQRHHTTHHIKEMTAASSKTYSPPKTTEKSLD